MSHCSDWVEVHDGTSTQRYCGGSSSDCGYSYCNYCDYCGSTPGPVTGTTITVKLYTYSEDTASGFFAVVTGDVTVTTDVTGESVFGKCVIDVIINNVSLHHDTFPCILHDTSSSHHHLQWQHQHLHLRPGQQTHQDCWRAGD